MFKITACAIVSLIALGGNAFASCTSFPYTLTNGTTADASQVMSNFNYLPGCLAPLAAPSFTGNASFAGNVIMGTGGQNFAADPISIYARMPGAFVVQNLSAATTYFIVNTSNGNVGIDTNAPSYPLQVNGLAGGTSAWMIVSDGRLKKNIEQISGAMNLVKRLRGVRYDWKQVNEREVGKKLKLPADERQIGLIAQEVYAVVPEAVVRPNDAEDGLYGLKESALVPLLIEAAKEQQAEIESLKTEIAALKSAKPAVP